MRVTVPNNPYATMPDGIHIHRAFVITVEQARKIDPTLRDLADEELEKLIVDLYQIGRLALESFRSKGD